MQGANLISNLPHKLTEAGRSIERIVSHALDAGGCEVEITAEDQNAWVELLLSAPGRNLAPSKMG